MKAWLVREWCEPEGMKFEDVQLPEPGPAQVRIRNKAASLNFFDLLQIQGKYQVKPAFPFTPGAEVSGLVDAIGSDVTTLKKGDRVMAMASGGGYGEYSLADSYRTFPLPASMGWNEAAAMPIVYHTSWFALSKRANLQQGETLLVHAGASGVGMSAIQIGKAMGAKVIATAGEDQKVAFVKSQGADVALNYTDPNWVNGVKEATERRGADVIYDPVGGDIFDLSTKCIASEGRLLVVGFVRRTDTNDTGKSYTTEEHVGDWSVLGREYANTHPWYIRETQNALEKMYADGAISPSVTSTYRLSEAPKAMQDIAARRVIGKAVLTMG